MRTKGSGSPVCPLAGVISGDPEPLVLIPTHYPSRLGDSGGISGGPQRLAGLGKFSGGIRKPHGNLRVIRARWVWVPMVGGPEFVEFALVRPDRGVAARKAVLKLPVALRLCPGTE